MDKLLVTQASGYKCTSRYAIGCTRAASEYIHAVDMLTRVLADGCLKRHSQLHLISFTVEVMYSKIFLDHPVCMR
jgi:hypothetical protein